MKYVIVDAHKFCQLHGTLDEAATAEVKQAAVLQSRLDDADESWAQSARDRSGARYLGWFYAPKYQRDVLVLNSDGSLIR